MTTICGTGSQCEKHDIALHGYPCGACHEEWARRSPRVRALISQSVTRNVTPAQMNKARKEDRAARESYSGPHEITVEKAGPSGPVSKYWNVLCAEECGWSYFWAKSRTQAEEIGDEHLIEKGAKAA